ncbi:MAG: hypothetical protein AAF726_16975 [Planctomycetota bacterium]
MQITVLAALTLALSLPAPAQTDHFSDRFDDASNWTLVGTAEVSSIRPPWLAQTFHGDSALAVLDSTWHATSAWDGSARSIPIDLSSLASPTLSFWSAWWHEFGCGWDAGILRVVCATSPGTVFYEECLSTAPELGSQWGHAVRPLDAAWGTVVLEFSYDPIDPSNWGQEWGYLVDELRIYDAADPVSILCEPAPLSSGAAGPDLEVMGGASASAASIVLRGSGFHPNAFALGSITRSARVQPAGLGVLCVAGGRRFPVAPTTSLGAAEWQLSTTDASFGHLIVPGETVYLQTYFRDGVSFNFSQALRVVVQP